eukprot:PhF_6_TR3346/c1_g1_i1/m.4727
MGCAVSTRCRHDLHPPRIYHCSAVSLESSYELLNQIEYDQKKQLLQESQVVQCQQHQRSQDHNYLKLYASAIISVPKRSQHRGSLTMRSENADLGCSNLSC